MYSRPLPHRQPFSAFFWGKGAAVVLGSSLKPIIRLWTVRENWQIKSGGLYPGIQRIFVFLSILMVRSEAASTRPKASVQSREPYQTESTVYFILGILRTDLWSQGRRIVHSKWKLFHFQIKTKNLSGPNYQTDNPSYTNNPSLMWKRPFLL